MALSMGLSGGGPVAAGEDAELLPNLHPRWPTSVWIDPQADETRLLRFTTEVLNKGVGPLELEPVAEDCDEDGDFDNDRLAYQHIYSDSNGDGYFTRGVDTRPPRAVQAGCSFFHPDHNHWHFEDFARYQLLGFNADGSIGDPVVPVSEKVSFCLVDSNRARRRLPGSPSSAHYSGFSPDPLVGCGPDDVMGISIGWADVYSSLLPGQSFTLPADFSDGAYCLKVMIDPSNRLDETNERNSRKMKVTIDKNAVEYQPRQSC